MRYSHENLKKIEEYLICNGLQPSVDPSLVKRIYHDLIGKDFKVKDTVSVKTRIRAFTLQYDFVRRDLHKLMCKESVPKGGFVYAISNKAWPDFLKIGSTVDIDDRLISYQTASPLRDYSVVSYFFADDRLYEEKFLHSLYPQRQGEWCQETPAGIRNLFKERQKLYRIEPDSDIVWVHRDSLNNALFDKGKNWYDILKVEEDDQ